MSKFKKVLNAGSIAERISQVETNLTTKLKLENFADKDISTIYNPLEYAKEPHEDYLKKWCNSSRQVMFLGMNPGPFGMCQNGVPFGEIDTVKDWLKIQGKVNKPEKEDRNRPIEGMNVKRKEMSGLRLWGLFKEVSKTPEVFFNQCVVYNFIPLCFIGPSGKNIAPDQLKPHVRKRLIKLCGDALCEIIDIMQIKTVVCVGKWTEARVNEMKKESKLPIQVLGIMHPSPLNVKANKDYIGDVRKDLERLNVIKYLLSDAPTEDNAPTTKNAPKKTMMEKFCNYKSKVSNKMEVDDKLKPVNGAKVNGKA